MSDVILGSLNTIKEPKFLVRLLSRSFWCQLAAKTLRKHSHTYRRLNTPKQAIVGLRALQVGGKMQTHQLET